MNLLLLSGNSYKNKAWIEQVEINGRHLFVDTYYQNYNHWINNKPEINIDLETERLKNLDITKKPYIVFAKSAGSILLTKAIFKGVLKPKACVVVGLPMAMIEKDNLKVNEWLNEVSIPIVILQHTKDPLGTYASVKDYLSTCKNANIALKELPGDTHDYLEHKEFVTVLKNLLV